MSSTSDHYSEPSSGTDLDDENVREADLQELNADDSVEVDVSAEREAAQFPLQPAERQAAEREMAARDLYQQNVQLPLAVRQQMQRRLEGENVAEQLQQMQFESQTSQAAQENQMQIGISDAASSLQSDQLRKIAARQFIMHTQQPLKDDALQTAITDLINQQNNQQLRELVVVKFLHFLKTYQQNVSQDLQPPKYIIRAHELFGNQQKSSITIDLIDLHIYSECIAKFLVQHPKLALSILNESIQYFINELERNSQLVNQYVEARIRVDEDPAGEAPLSIIQLKQLNTEQINRLIAVRGVVLTRNDKKPRLVQAYFECKQCKNLIGPIDIKNNAFIQMKPVVDQNVLSLIIPKCCTNESCKSRSLHLYSPYCVYQDIQKITVQERQEDVEPGYMPEKREVLISGDLINQINPGDNVQITGTYIMLQQQNLTQAFPYNQTLIEANHVSTEQDININISPKDCIDMDLFARLFTGDDLDHLIFKSIAPSIHGHQQVKQAITMSLIGGVSHQISPDQPKTRGDMHVLLLGDPGIAKSQLLRYVQQCAPKSILTSGKGASAAGLTVAVKRSQAGDFQLQAGALVLANNGVCLIDELDKMDDKDRVALHQAMEQQEISIAKAGIIATLPARTAVIAAANPNNQQYNVNIPLTYNINIGEALLSRFDLTCILRDVPDEQGDLRLARFVVNSHAKSHESNRNALDGLDNLRETLQIITDRMRQLQDQEQSASLQQQAEQIKQQIIEQKAQLALFVEEQQEYQIPEQYTVNQVVGYAQTAQESFILSQNFLRRYFSYARTMEPTFGQEIVNQISNFYTTLRSRVQDINGVQVTQRAIGTLFRLTEAHAKLHLQKTCVAADVQWAINFYSQLFVQMQKASQLRRVERELRRFRAEGNEDFMGMLAILDDCFRRINNYRRQGIATDEFITVHYLRNECTKSQIELVDSFFQKEEFMQNYILNVGADSQVIYQK